VLAPIGAGAYGRQLSPAARDRVWSGGNSSAGIAAAGITEVEDSATYGPPPSASVEAAVVRAAEEQRPYLKLSGNLTFVAAQPNATLELDGLWLGSSSAAHVLSLSAVNAAASFERVTLRACTLDPGGTATDGSALPAIRLSINCFVEELVIERCILAGIFLGAAGAGVERIRLRDSIVDARAHADVALALPTTHLDMERCTLLAPQLTDTAIQVERIDASSCLVAGTVVAADQQAGCFRYSASAAGSRLPHPYRSSVLSSLAGVFRGRRFGHPDYLQLSEAAPSALTQGNEQGGELGAHAGEQLSIKRDSLLAKVHELLPFGRLPNLKIEN
jgi:hypothetical protein